MSTIPFKIVNFNLYNGADKYIGITEEITLPDFEAMSETISGAGIAGEFEAPTPGHFGSQTIEIPFRTIDRSSFDLMKNKASTLILRAAQQSYAISKGNSKIEKLRITVKGIPKGINLGKVAINSPTDTTVTMEILYIKIEQDGRTLIELDKLNFVYIVDGEDLLEDVRNAI